MIPQARSGMPIPVVPPQHVETTAANGSRTVLLDRPGSDYAEFRVAVPLPRGNDLDAAHADVLGGLPLAVSSRSPVDRATTEQWVLSRNAELDVLVDPDTLIVTGRAASENLCEVLQATLGSLVPVTYADGDFERARSGALRRSAMFDAHPTMAVRRSLLEHRWGRGDPAARDTAPVEAITRVQPETMTAFVSRSLGPAGSHVVISADFGMGGCADWTPSARRVADIVASWSGDVGPARSVTNSAREYVQTGRYTVAAPNDSLARLRLSAASPPRSNHRFAAMQVLAVLLGGYFSSRLVQELRELRGDVYSIVAGFETRRTASHFVISADLPPDRLESVESVVTNELKQLRSDGPTTAEVAAAVRYAVGSLGLGLTSQQSVTHGTANLVSSGLSPDWWTRHGIDALKVTPQDVRAVAQDFLHPQ